MQLAKPVLCLVSLAAILAIVGMIATSSDAQSSQSSRQRNSQASQTSRIGFEYATLTSVQTAQSGQTTYQVFWDVSDFSLEGKSTQSIEDAYRKLVGRLGGPTSSVSNLSSMLTRIGADGWELIETSGLGSTTTRIFIRRT